MFDNSLLQMHKDKEKLIHDTWVEGCGINILVSPVKLLGDDNKRIMHDADPFGIEADYVGYDDGVITEYGNNYNTYAIFTDADYEPISVSDEIAIDEQGLEADVQNHNSVHGYISGVFVPKGSLIQFDQYQSIKMRVNNVRKKRPQSDIYLYELGRA